VTLGKMFLLYLILVFKNMQCCLQILSNSYII